MDPQTVPMEDCIPRCIATHPLTGAHCVLFADHEGEHVLEHIDRTVKFVKQNQITRYKRRA